MILEIFPEHPAYYDKEELTDRSQRFFVSEIIREKIFNNYQKEIPYSTEVIVTAFKEEQTKAVRWCVSLPKLWWKETHKKIY